MKTRKDILLKGLDPESSSHILTSVDISIYRQTLEGIKTPTCMEKTLRAGMGMMAAEKKASMLLMDVRSIVVPVRFKHSGVCSCETENTNVYVYIYNHMPWLSG